MATTRTEHRVQAGVCVGLGVLGLVLGLLVLALLVFSSVGDDDPPAVAFVLAWALLALGPAAAAVTYRSRSWAVVTGALLLVPVVLAVR